MIIAWVRFAESLQQALDRCAPRNRDMSPELARLLILLPIVNAFCWFRIIGAVDRSLRREFGERGLDRGGSYEAIVGVAAGAIAIVATLALSTTPIFEDSPKIQGIVAGFGLLSGFVAVTLWAVYWTMISNLLTRLRNDEDRRNLDDFDDDDPPPRRSGPERIEDRYR
jgi:hypothetical protein